MESYSPDDVDVQLLARLQEDARYTAVELADRIGVSDNTIHKRMRRLEDAGVVTGYRAVVDHDRIGLRLHFLFVCTVRISERGAVAQRALAFPEVVEVTELMTGRRNLQIKLVVSEDERITELAQELDQLDLDIDDEILIRAEHTKPIDYAEIDHVWDEEA